MQSKLLFLGDPVSSHSIILHSYVYSINSSIAGQLFTKTALSSPPELSQTN